MVATRSGTSPSTERELVITRVFEARRELVFAAWTEREHLDRWQGAPQGFTVTVEQSDIRPGGKYRICMRSPDGVDHWLQGTYREVVHPERLVFTHMWTDAHGTPGPETLVTVTLVEHAGKTELTLRQTGFPSDGSRDGHRDGWTSTFDRLAEYLGGLR
ncbi:MAG: SRPBCC family protein [Gemmatimonadales bacterium]